MLRWGIVLSCWLALAAAASEALADGASIYATSCAGCHGTDGSADTGIGKALQIPSFKGSSFTREQLETILKNERHARLGLEPSDAEMESLVAALNALASAP